MLLTGSHDGTARVWRWRGRLASFTHIKLLAPEEARLRAHESVLASHTGNKVRTLACKQSPTQSHCLLASAPFVCLQPLAVWVDMVAWSSDDRYAFTSESLRKQTQVSEVFD